jgi:tetratricopeptide (TPR) repeat protein
LLGGTAILLVGLGGAVTTVAGEPLPRGANPAGAVIDRKTGEEVRFVDLSDWRNVELRQDLLGGDVLRTNAVGQLAILFADHTQVRLGRNSALQVKRMGTAEDTVLNLQSGTMWARAERGGQGLTVETPAAAAAIRGTDWTLTVEGDKTTLTVLEGKVELRNEFGSVEVREGEAALATIGQAPRKLVIVTPPDRQQMLFYLTLRNGFTFMPATPLPVKDARSERQRINAIPPESRTIEDWLSLAEVRMMLDGQADALQALDAVRGRKLSARDRARVDLIDGLVAGSRQDYGTAAQLFARASRNLDPKRRAIAAYAGYFSRSLLDPTRVEQPPREASGPYAAIMQAYAQGFLQDIPTALKEIQKAEARFPQDGTLPAVRALLSILAGDREQAKEASERALALDPENHDALLARAMLRSDYEGNLNGAMADLKEAIRIAPGSSTAWNNLGLIYDTKGAIREAEAAFLKAVELDPDDPVSHANLAIFYLGHNRIAEAKAEIDKVMAVDPAFDIGLVARGRYHLQTGEIDRAVQDLLAGSTANPGYSQAQLLLAAAQYMKGERDASNQALDNADRLDRNDPTISSVRTALAIDDYDAEAAIRNAQEYLRRSRAQGGDYASLSANQDAGSTLNNAFRLQGLDAWGRYYGDAVFDPFSGTSYVDQSIHGQVDPFANTYIFGSNTAVQGDSNHAFSSLFQGLLIDPHMLAGRSRTATLLRSPFLDAELSGGFIDVDGETRKTAEAEIQGYSNGPVPTSVLADFSWAEIPATGDYPGFGGYAADTELLGGNGYLTFSPTLDDRIVIYGNHSRGQFGLDSLTEFTDFGIPLPLFRTRDDDNRITNAGIGWSHTFGYRNVANAAILYNGIRSSVDKFFVTSLLGIGLPIGLQRDRSEQDTYVAAVNHAIGNDDFTVRYGLEGGIVESSQSELLVEADYRLFPPVIARSFDSVSGTSTIGRAYVDVLQEFSPSFRAEYGLFATLIQGDGSDVRRLDPRVGIAWAPNENNWLRIAYMRNGVNAATPTLAPVDVLGIQPNQFDLTGSGYADTLAMAWDAEWSDDFFTSVEYQHQELRDFTVGFPLTSFPPFDSIAIAEGRVDRVSLTANAVLGHGFGLSGTVAFADSGNRDPLWSNRGGSLPYIPDSSGQVALTWVNDANIKATIAANYVGERDGDELGTRLDDYWTLDASAIWEPFDKAIALEATAFNLLDEEFEVAPGVPGWGRGVKGMLRIRF